MVNIIYPNALGAIEASMHVSVKPVLAIGALSNVQNVKRLMEVRVVINDITLHNA